MKDVGAYFKITDCFLCGEKAEIDFNCFYGGELYKAPICFSCMSSHESDQHVLLAVLKKANKLHDEQEFAQQNALRTPSKQAQKASNRVRKSKGRASKKPLAQAVIQPNQRNQNRQDDSRQTGEHIIVVRSDTRNLQHRQR